MVKWYLKEPDLEGSELIRVVKGAFSSQEIDQINQAASNTGLQAGTISSEKKIVHSIRNSGVSFLAPSENTAWLYQKCTRLVNSFNLYFNFNLSYIEGLQYTVYEGNNTKPGHYIAHADESSIFNGINDIRKLSIVTLLCDPSEFEGGEFKFYNFTLKPSEIFLQKGDTIAFPSYMLHEVSPVTKGIRRSLVGWIHGPAWR
jgi:PKHD-type hydroxylase